jgi:hypothetical protein
MRPDRRVCTFDIETDPFKAGRIPVPFSCGFYDGETYLDWWGADCIERAMFYISTRTDKLLIYVHNGGGFDFNYLLPYCDYDATPLIINRRLVTASFVGQEWRDSYRIIPIPLAAYRKDEIAYEKLEADVREANKDEILRYQRTDCEALYELVTGFRERFGDKVTIASTALPLLKKLHPYESLSEGMDSKLRRFYAGGRVQCFATGVFRGSWKIVDRNSMYPAVMAQCSHPIGSRWWMSEDIRDTTWFVIWRGKSHGCAYTRKNGLSFVHAEDVFYSTIHEINAGLETGTIEIASIVECWNCDKATKFDAFVLQYYALRKQAKAEGDKLGDIFNKLIMNSSYGKLGMDPREHEQFRVMQWGLMPHEGLHDKKDNPKGWGLQFAYKKMDGAPAWGIWGRPSATRWNNFHNVATAASITGAARANLFRAIRDGLNVLYCDTDSLICEAFNGDMGDDLGQWKVEAEGCLVAICGRKTYAVYSREPPTDAPKWWVQDPEGHTYTDPELGVLYCIKKACKGVNVSGNQIIDIALGREMRWSNPVPSFKLGGGVAWVERTIRKTGDVEGLD